MQHRICFFVKMQIDEKHFSEVVKCSRPKHHKIISNQNNRVVSEWNRETTNSRKIELGENLENPEKFKKSEILTR